MRKVFISSTTDDLEAYRTAARDAVIRAGCYPVMMEYWSANGNRPPYRACMDKVDECDTLIAIVAHRYGWVPCDQPNGDSRSITWLECERAKEVLAFLIDENHNWPPELRDSFRLSKAVEEGTLTAELATEVGRDVVQLKEFKAWLNRQGIRGTFRNEHELQTAILQALLGSTEKDASQYMSWLREYASWIDIRGLQVGAGKAYRFPIQDLYIPLTAAAALGGTGEMTRKVALEETITGKRTVIMGDPGSGKTTFLRRLALECCSPTGEFAIPPGSFPLFIRIGELEEHIANCSGRKTENVPSTFENPGWLPHFLGSRGWGLNRDYFDRQMHNERTVVLLDGLDEAPDTRIRERMARLFENAAKHYHECLFVVTTRPGAYQGLATLADFQLVRIDDLDDDAVERFLAHWSKGLHPGDAMSAEAHRQQLVESVRARAPIRRMARNPVMLTALAVVHWNDRRLPEQRAELYESVLTWLARAREKPGRESAEKCLLVLGQLALGMQNQPRGRLRQVRKRRAAEMIAPVFRDTAEGERIERATRFLEQEEVDSGIVVSRGTKLEFWHLTFQEHLAARAIAGMRDTAQQNLLINGGRLYEPEWREVVLLYAGQLASRQGPEKVDALFSAVLDRQGQSLAEQARCAGLLGAVLADLRPTGYQPQDARYDLLMAAVLAIFTAVKAREIPLQIRVEAAEALGQAGDPRLRENNWVRIEPCTFQMGKDKEAHQVELDGYEIGRYPVTVEEFARFVDDGGPAPGDWDEQLRHPNRPVVYVSWGDAAAYCAWARARLPTEAEWERAACGQEGRPYPWGHLEPDETLANYRGTPIGAPTPVGLFPAGATAEGICDLAGNVWEWVQDRYGEYPQNGQRNPRGPDAGEFRVVRGGSWGSDSTGLCATVRSIYAPGGRYILIGFRCAR